MTGGGSAMKRGTAIGQTPRTPDRLAFVDDTQAAARLAKAIVLYALADLRVRFDRTVLGPFWILVTTAVWVGTVGVLMAQLFKQPITRELPYLTFGVFGWTFVSSVLIESSSTFSGQKTFLLAYRLPLMFCVLRVATRNFFVLSMLTGVGILVAGGFGLLRVTLFFHVAAVWGVMLFCMVPVVIIVGIAGSRYADTAPLMVIVMNILVMATPIFWRASALAENHPAIRFNPLVPIIDVYRDLFLRGGASAESYLDAIVVGCGLWLVAFCLFELTHKKIRLWL